MTHPFLSLSSKSSGLNLDVSDLGPTGVISKEAALLSQGTGLYKQQLHLGTYYQSKLQFDSLLLFTSALITGWGKECLRFAKIFGEFFFKFLPFFPVVQLCWEKQEECFRN